MMGINSYRLPIDYGRSVRATGLQRAAFPTRAAFGVIGTNSYGGGTQFASRMIARGRAMQEFGIGGSMGATESRPWWESLFGHIENMTTIAAPFVVQILDASFDQQRAGWAQQSADKREAAYQTMIKDLVKTKAGGTSDFSDPQTRAFILQQFQKEPATTQNSVINSLTGGDAQQSAALVSLTATWYEKPGVIALVIAGVAGAIGLAFAFSRR